MSREVHVRFWERVRVKFPRATRFPLYRQSQIFDREGLDLDRSTLANWVGKTTALLEPLADAIGRHALLPSSADSPAAFSPSHPAASVRGPRPGTGRCATTPHGPDRRTGGRRSEARRVGKECTAR